MIICYTVPEIWCVTDAIVIFQYGLTARKMKILKQWKKRLEI